MYCFQQEQKEQNEPLNVRKEIDRENTKCEN